MIANCNMITLNPIFKDLSIADLKAIMDTLANIMNIEEDGGEMHASSVTNYMDIYKATYMEFWNRLMLLKKEVDDSGK